MTLRPDYTLPLVDYMPGAPFQEPPKLGWIGYARAHLRLSRTTVPGAPPSTTRRLTPSDCSRPATYGKPPTSNRRAQPFTTGHVFRHGPVMTLRVGSMVGPPVSHREG